MSLETRIEKLKSAFDLENIKTENTTEGFFASKVTKFYIPEENFKKILADFPFLKNAVKAGIFQRDKLAKAFTTNSKTLMTKNTDRRSFGSKQFFSLKGDDRSERTTLYDAIYTICNIKMVAQKLGLKPDSINYSIRHKNGNPDEVTNFIEFDPAMFGKNEKEQKKNIQRINQIMNS